jgi:hypothetical protein
MLKWERIEKLEQAQEKLNEAVRLIRLAVEDTNNERYCESYIIGHLKNWANGEHTLDTTIPKLIEEIEKEYYE